MRIAIIAAIARNRVIGRDGRLPWHIPEDLTRFQRLTMGHALLMGRRTCEAIGTPLPGRRSVVVTSRPIAGVETCPSPEAALALLAGEPLVFVIGGSAMFAAFLLKADLLYLTQVDEAPEGDAFFPPYEAILARRFRLISSEQHTGFRFDDYERAF
jgi:dihydrofolate reductase